jgi:hypothetical protein
MVTTQALLEQIGMILHIWMWTQQQMRTGSQQQQQVGLVLAEQQVACRLQHLRGAAAQVLLQQQ